EQQDIVVGSVVSNRNRIEIEGLIGCFVNTLILRCSLHPRDSISKLLKKVRETLLEAYAHQEVPFDKIVEDLAPARDLARLPLVQATIVLQNLPQNSVIELPGLRVTNFGGERETS